MILYRKAPQLRVRRAVVPEAPYWAATTIAPYAPKRATPIAIDYLALRATGGERVEVPVSENVRDELERVRMLGQPVLIDATEIAETIFRRGEEALAFCRDQQLAAIQLISTRGSLPLDAHDATLVIAAWPLELDRLEQLFAAAAGRTWGVAVPLVYPITTDLGALTTLSELAHHYGARFLTGLPIEIDPTAKQAIAQSLELDGEDETYAMLFHSDVEPLHVATERHIAALAASLKMEDFILPPRWEERSNWNGAVLLTLTASRMLAMEHDVELASTIARSARVVSELDKPLTRIAAAASLGIVDALDEVSVEMLTEWIAGEEPEFVQAVNRKWRMRRDYGV